MDEEKTMQIFFESASNKGVTTFRNGWKAIVSQVEGDPHGYDIAFIKYIEEYQDNLTIQAHMTGDELEEDIEKLLKELEQDAIRFKKVEHMN